MISESGAAKALGGAGLRNLLEPFVKLQAEANKADEPLEYYDLNHFDSYKKPEAAPSDLMGTLSEISIKGKPYTCVFIDSNFENAEQDLQLLTNAQSLAAIPKILSVKRDWNNIHILFENIGEKVLAKLPALPSHKLFENLLSGVQLIEYLYNNDIPHNPLSPYNTYVDSKQNLKFFDLSAQDQGSFVNNLRVDRPIPEGMLELEQLLPQSYLKRDKTFDGEDLMLTDIYGLATSLLFLIDRDAALEGVKEGWNNNPKVMNAVLEKCLEARKIDANFAFLLAHMLMADPLRRPTIELLPFVCEQLKCISLIADSLKEEKNRDGIAPQVIDRFNKALEILKPERDALIIEEGQVSEEIEAKLMETLRASLPKEFFSKSFLGHIVTRYRESKRPFFSFFEFIAKIADFGPLIG